MGRLASVNPVTRPPRAAQLVWDTVLDDDDRARIITWVRQGVGRQRLADAIHTAYADELADIGLTASAHIASGLLVIARREGDV